MFPRAVSGTEQRSAQGEGSFNAVDGDAVARGRCGGFRILCGRVSAMLVKKMCSGDDMLERVVFCA